MARRKLFMAGLVLLASVFFAGSVLAAEEVKYRNKSEVPRITVEALKAKLERGEKVYILDMRTGASYDSSPHRIKGDIRSTFGELRARTSAIPRGGEIITYCT